MRAQCAAAVGSDLGQSVPIYPRLPRQPPPPVTPGNELIMGSPARCLTPLARITDVFPERAERDVHNPIEQGEMPFQRRPARQG